MVRVGSICSGYEGLGLGVCAAFGWDPWQSIVWHADNDKAASKVLAHRFPDVPNLGDITTVDWATVPPVEVLIGGTPCQDLSHAGRRGGMKEGTRSNLWVQMREAVAVLKPCMVVWENVAGALSADADSEMEPCAGCVGDGTGEPVLRALGRVCGDLSTLGYDSRWTTVPASAVGACHRRERVFLAAYPADAPFPEWGISQREHLGTGLERTAESGERVSPDTHSGTTTEWGDFQPAVVRWERVLGRRAPAATEPNGNGGQRLSAPFAEWMLGLPDGWVTAVPELTPGDMLRIVGNGCVPQQAAYALQLLTSSHDSD
jgi:DNA (cytosine-5)-methyltransferase 1